MAGQTHFMLGEFEQAKAELETARKLAPNDYDVAYILGLAYLKQHQFAPAKQIYERMIEQLGDRIEIRWPSGVVDKITAVNANRLLTAKEGQELLNRKILRAPHGDRFPHPRG